MTITEAIFKVLKDSGKPLSYKDIYEKIVDYSYYSFGAKDPVSVVRGKIRRHCYGVDFPSASPKKIFIEVKTLGQKTKPLYDIWNGKVPKTESLKDEKINKEQLPEEIIHSKYKEHINNIRNELLDAIHSSEPAFFERLVVKLLLKIGYGQGEILAGKSGWGSGR
ncbi:winged helix-turn-helix domain-containing protein [Xenorhabdus cabanillasii]|uniref:winged helix-turn-helix domain-containing protein n=1 Tax=Xenorhabdus cabanillasii TaxID=351673 RepID=UPI001FD50C95|nr:winged helix-turn-helix domain-containing protein [Xenorhabdus cabanillasii]